MLPNIIVYSLTNVKHFAINKDMNNNLKAFGLITLALNAVYLIWLSQNTVGIFGFLLFLAEALLASLTLLFIFNHWTQHKYHIIKTKLEREPNVDVFLTVVNEPLEIFEETLRAASAIDYTNKKVYVLDDGSREDVKFVAQKYSANYLSRPEKIHSKAGNLNYGLANSNSEFILVLDADQIAEPNIIKDLVGYFEGDSKLAMVTTRQSFMVPDDDFNHDILFYEHMLPGKNADNSAISCGSGVIYRRAAIEHVEGFQTWNVVEDLYTSYILHSKDYTSHYVNKSYTRGTAPQDLSNIYKQRGTWALDTLRMFFRKSPFIKRGLSFRQRMHYIELSWAYIVSAIGITILFLLPPVTLVLDKHIISNEMWYPLFRGPSLLAILMFYYILSGKVFSTSQFWAGLSPVYLKALVLSLMPFKTKYKVTAKLAGPNKRDIALILPQLAFVLFGVGAVVWRVFWVDHSLTPFVQINMIWITLMTFWVYPIIKKGLALE